MSNDDTTNDDTTRLEQTVQNEPTERLDTSDATRAIGVDEPQQPTEVGSGPVQFDDQQPVFDEQRPVSAAAADPGTDQRVGDQRVGDQAAWPPAVPDRPSGPHAPAIVLGLVCLAVACIVLAQELGSLSVDWGDVGPLGIVASGAVLVLFGLVGLLTSRRSSKQN